MKPTFLFVLLLVLGSCQKPMANHPPAASYADFLAHVKTERARLRNENREAARTYFFGLIHRDIPEYWAGTPWDFNGTTRVPRQGSIACGYFITNTLVDLGFPIERVKLAQAASSVLIKTVTTDIAYPKSVEGLRQYALARPDESVYIVGLDFHTGYVTRKGNSVYFIHSNYINRKGVSKELVEESAALANNKFFMIGSISANSDLLRQWLEN